MDNETTTLNQEQASSASSGTGQSGGQEEAQVDVESSSQDGPRNSELLKVAQQAYEQSTRRERTGHTQDTEQDETSRPQSGQDAQGKEQSAKGQPDAQQKANEKQVEKVPEQGQEQVQAKTEEQQKGTDEVPFHNHPRWQEMLSQRDQLQQKVTALKPMEDHYTFHQQYMQRYGISQQDVANAMEFLAMQKTNPARALELLKPIQESLKEFDPNVLPKDLQQLVDSDEMTPKAAKMIAQERAQANQLKRQMEQSQAQQQVSKDQATTQAMASWDLMKRGNDPDFKPKDANDKNAPDGLWEWTARNFAYEQTMNFAVDPASVVRNLEKAYKDAKGMVARLGVAKQPIRQHVTSSQSSSASAPVKKVPKTAYDVTKMVAAKHGINYTPPSEQSED